MSQSYEATNSSSINPGLARARNRSRCGRGLDYDAELLAQANGAGGPCRGKDRVVRKAAGGNAGGREGNGRRRSQGSCQDDRRLQLLAQPAHRARPPDRELGRNWPCLQFSWRSSRGLYVGPCEAVVLSQRSFGGSRRGGRHRQPHRVDRPS